MYIERFHAALEEAWAEVWTVVLLVEGVIRKPFFVRILHNTSTYASGI